MAQTVVQNSSAIRFGSGVMEVGENVNSLVNLGAMRGIEFEETWDEVKIQSDNAGEVYAGIKNHKASLMGSLMEIALDNLALIRGGIDNASTVPGTPVADHVQKAPSGSWKYDNFIVFELQNCDKSKIEPDSVVGSVDGSMTDRLDYEIIQAPNGLWGISITDSATVTTMDQELTFTYDATPCEAKILRSGGLKEISPRVVRVTNFDENGKAFRITVFKATNAQGIKLTFQPDDGDDPNMVEVKMEGTLDVARAAGEQLFEIYDEQAV